jgi:hypothetical protein
MLAAVTAGASHPVVAALLGLGAAGLAGAVVAMAWNVHASQIRLAELLARRQFTVASERDAPGGAANGQASAAAVLEHAAAAGNGGNGGAAGAAGTAGAAGPGAAAPVIDGPDTVVTGEQARYRIRPSGSRTVVSWAAGGGPLSQFPDPAHQDELLLIADQPGTLTIMARVREGMTERRATKPVTAVADATAAAPPFSIRLFLHGWGLVAVAVLIVGFAGALDALGDLASADFIALVAPLTALLGVVALARGTDDPPGRPGKDATRPRLRP